jgi:hypothetical protein
MGSSGHEPSDVISGPYFLLSLGRVEPASSLTHVCLNPGTVLPERQHTSEHGPGVVRLAWCAAHRVAPRPPPCDRGDRSSQGWRTSYASNWCVRLVHDDTWTRDRCCPRNALALGHHEARIERPLPDLSVTNQFRNSTGVPLSTMLANSSASQFVRRTHPCEAVLPTLSGSGVP